ncbi:ATP-dependent Clp protease adapter protein clpS [Striga asiatica]|uniref:ATP-dependent Clp protease adapter protein clpS n=1 Tax=Striga asiatica TaxID=4170 RepID=A0A5A7R2F5_STRAF|nr:ATP-dependent Clp protease adapter protein clpS [Striga asiatica]
MMARIISKPLNNFFSFSCGVNIWEPSTFRTYAEHQPSKGFQLKHNLKFGDCCSIKEAEREDGGRTKEILLVPKVKCQLMEKESKGEGFDFDWPPWKNLPQGYELAGRTSIVFVICNTDKVNFSISRIPMSHQSGWNASVAGLVQSTFFCGYIHSLFSGGWIVKSFGGRIQNLVTTHLYNLCCQGALRFTTIWKTGRDIWIWVVVLAACPCCPHLQMIVFNHEQKNIVVFTFLNVDYFQSSLKKTDAHLELLIDHKQWATLNTLMTMQVVGDSKGGGVLDKPIIEKTTPGRESEFDLRKSRKMSPPYRVLLHNDDQNKREYVVQVLMKVIDGMTLDNAVNIMQEAHYNGMSVVIVCGQEDAEEYCMQLRGNGLLSSIEPADGGGCH